MINWCDIYMIVCMGLCTGQGASAIADQVYRTVLSSRSPRWVVVYPLWWTYLLIHIPCWHIRWYIAYVHIVIVDLLWGSVFDYDYVPSFIICWFNCITIGWIDIMPFATLIMYHRLSWVSKSFMDIWFNHVSY